MTRKPQRYSKASGQGLYAGDLPFLMELVRLTKEPGQWEEMDNYWRFRCDTGAIYNWWPSTGTFNFQGPCDQKERFSLKMMWASFQYGDLVSNAMDCGYPLLNYHIPVWSDEENS